MSDIIFQKDLPEDPRTPSPPPALKQQSGRPSTPKVSPAVLPPPSGSPEEKKEQKVFDELTTMRYSPQRPEPRPLPFTIEDDTPEQPAFPPLPELPASERISPVYKQRVINTPASRPPRQAGQDFDDVLGRLQAEGLVAEAVEEGAEKPQDKDKSKGKGPERALERLKEVAAPTPASAATSTSAPESEVNTPNNTLTPPTFNYAYDYEAELEEHRRMREKTLGKKAGK